MEKAIIYILVGEAGVHTPESDSRYVRAFREHCKNNLNETVGSTQVISILKSLETATVVSHVISAKIKENGKTPDSFLFVAFGFDEETIRTVVYKTKQPITVVGFANKYKGRDHNFGEPAVVSSFQKFHLGIDNSGPTIRQVVIKDQLQKV